jgi:2-(1,2-epoxy-1,2-dihydrophenyl)acetyl-CoA isomerase
MVGAREAEAMGLVNKVVPVDELDAVADEWGRRLAAGPTLALSLSKRLLDASSSVTFEQALEDEARCQHITYTSQDMQEGISAFLERRQPKFRGC